MSNQAKQKRINVFIPIDLWDFIESQISEGKYKDISDLINKLLDREFQKSLLSK
jgi:Arc/MetJ-type ribon-helix-helix transcriptional regulator